MADDVLINKAAVIERCVARVREEYNSNPATFATDFTRQDAAILNIHRACEAALDMGQHLIRKEKLGAPPAIVAAVTDDVKRFKGHAQQADDITLICLQYKG